MKGHPITWFPEEMAWLEARQDWPRAELHKAFCWFWKRDDLTVHAIKALFQRKGWKTGRTGCFVKGQTPPNKGKKMPHNENSARTQFRKGQRPHTYRGPGHESIDNKDGYVWLIVEETNPHTGAATRRVQKHKWLWEKLNGPVPEGHVLKCLDSDKTNCDPSNWEALPKSMLPRLSGRWNLGYDEASPEVKPTIMAIAKLEQKARDLKNG
ncbi:HNH endonuclease signature motif containing protein [Pseudogemmobacter bohemicus]|uniref:HNH endonuclease signature motif containing protein n=1 Tax=Pseudogemmobacter bohemicus TaxID=2250708 RepID=UPI001E3FFE6D|nr:HNH endonuclease signature motif containing protein [Pseudogemmobacter bohemicus]